MDTFQFVVSFLFVLHAAFAVNDLPAFAEDCGSKKGVIESITISGCASTDKTCKLPKGTTIHVTIVFKSMEVINNATAVVHGIIKGVSVPFPIPQADGCKSGLSCPVKADSTSTYHSDIKVLEIYPALKVAVEWELKDEHGNEIFCAVFRSEIVS